LRDRLTFHGPTWDVNWRNCKAISLIDAVDLSMSAIAMLRQLSVNV